MNEHKTFCELIVTPAKTAGTRALEAALMLVYALITAGYFFLFYIMLGQWQPLILLPFIVFGLIRLTWRFTRVEYEIAVEAGALTVAKIYDKRSRRKKFSADIADFSLIRPLDADAKRVFNGADITERLDFSASPESPDAMLIVYPEKKTGRKTALVIETNDEVRRLLRLSNPGAFARR